MEKNAGRSIRPRTWSSSGSDDFTWKDVLELLRKEPGLAEINAGIQHRTLKDIDKRALKR